MYQTIARPSYMPNFKPDSSCVMWLPGQDDAPSTTIRDRSGYGNHGTITGATWNKNSQGVSYLSFNGSSDFINCGTSSTLNIAKSGAFVAWVKRNSDLNDHEPIIGNGSQWNLGIQLAIGSDDKPLLTYQEGSGAYRRIDCVSNSTLPVGIWTLLEGIITNSYMYIYLNGVLKGTSLDMSTYVNQSYDGVYIGKGMNKTSQVFKYSSCSISFCRVFNTPPTISFFQSERYLFGV
jgi:hypothetical protein